MVLIKPDALIVLGDTNSCLSIIGVKRFHITISIWEPETAVKTSVFQRRATAEMLVLSVRYRWCIPSTQGVILTTQEHTYVTGFPMTEVLHGYLEIIEVSIIY